MSDYLAKINEILEEHRTIRSGVKLVGDSVSDQEALVSLKKHRPKVYSLIYHMLDLGCQ